MKRIGFIFLILFILFQQKVWSKDIVNEFLIAEPQMKDSRFKETVIFMFSHNQDGAAGLVINKPIETMSINKLFKSSNLVSPKNIVQKEIILYWGGPVNSEHIFFVHSSDYKSNDIILSNNDFIITREPKVLFDIAKDKGPKNYLIISGIAVWSPGQLDHEMLRGDWKKKSNSYIRLFDNGREMWNRLINSQEI